MSNQPIDPNSVPTKIADALGVSPEALESLQRAASEENDIPLDQDTERALERAREFEKDYREARKKNRDLVEIAEMATQELAQLASESQNPRAYEVLAKMISAISGVNKDILDAHAKRQKAHSETKTTTNVTVNNDKAIFVGSTKDLLDQLRRMK
jgi:hypothetical protein